jgi:hypothetical protein
MKKITVFLMSICLALSIAGSAGAIPVDRELSLLIDVSGSINADEFNLQRNGYADAFNSAPIWNAISQGTIGKIAANIVYWSGASQQTQAVGWTLIESQTDAQNFATAISNTSRPFGGSTAVQSALEYATDLFVDNDFEGTTSVIDVSGDGARNAGLTGTAGRDYALINGIDTINGIVIGSSSSVLAYYQNNVIGGPNAFAMQVNNFDEFGNGIGDKLIKEISPEGPVPEPSTIILLGACLVCFVGYNRRRSNKKA